VEVIIRLLQLGIFFKNSKSGEFGQIIFSHEKNPLYRLKSYFFSLKFGKTSPVKETLHRAARKTPTLHCVGEEVHEQVGSPKERKGHLRVFLNIMRNSQVCEPPSM